jgi:hypothetical protein
MQDKHVVIFRGSEDRDILINKVKYPKTVYQIEGIGEPEEGDIVVSSRQVTDWILASYIYDNYENLSEFTIFAQANPDEHCESFLLAIDSTLTDGFGSFSLARSIYDQYCIGWPRIHPSILIAHELGINFHNDNNTRKFIYYCQPGQFFYVRKDRILQHPREFYKKLIELDDDQKLRETIYNHNFPDYFWYEINKAHPELKNSSKTDKLKKLTIKGRRDELFGQAMECLWSYVFSDKTVLEKLNKSQAVIGNKLYFNTRNSQYDLNFKFYIYPYHENPRVTINNFKLLENSWFDQDCSNYLKWKDKLIQRYYIECERFGSDGKTLLDYYGKMNIKHISV